MNHINFTNELVENLIEVMFDVGGAVLKIYNNYIQSADLSIKTKEDGSYLTEADLLSDNLIRKALTKLSPNIPCVSEESVKIIQHEDYFWLVDPLDGTKEFINKNGEFTINIALINHSSPIFGLVYAPALNKLFWGGKKFGSFTLDQNNKKTPIYAKHEPKKEILNIAASRSHANQDLQIFLNRLQSYNLLSLGSSYKFCLVANNEIDMYPRFGPTYEWDTAAGHSVLAGAGGFVYDEIGNPLTYRKDNYLNPSFFASNFSFDNLKSFYKK